MKTTLFHFLIMGMLVVGFLTTATPAFAYQVVTYKPVLPAGYQNVGMVADRLAANTQIQMMQYNTANYGYNNGYNAGCNSNYSSSNYNYNVNSGYNVNAGYQYNTAYGYNPSVGYNSNMNYGYNSGYNPTYNTYGTNNPNYNVTRPLVIQPMVNGQPCGVGTANPACLWSNR